MADEFVEQFFTLLAILFFFMLSCLLRFSGLKYPQIHLKTFEKGHFTIN